MVLRRERILITGGETFIGNHITTALLAEDAAVSVLIKPGGAGRLGQLADQVEWHEGDVWNPASLKGRARHAKVVIHTVGGVHADPATGLTHHYLNFLSLRNVADMCISDGAPHLIFISTAGALWFPNNYIRAKREGERYLARIGLQATIIRAPLLYLRHQPRSLVYRLVNLTAAISPFFQRSAPLPIDIFARGVARIAVNPSQNQSRYTYRHDLRRLNTRNERRGKPAQPTPTIPEPPLHEEDTRPNTVKK